MTIRIGKFYINLRYYMVVEVGTKAGHKFRVKCRSFNWKPGRSFNVTGMPGYTTFMIEPSDIEYVRQIH